MRDWRFRPRTFLLTTNFSAHGEYCLNCCLIPSCFNRSAQPAITFSQAALVARKFVVTWLSFILNLLLGGRGALLHKIRTFAGPTSCPRKCSKT